jgi:hypothetical protein
VIGAARALGLSASRARMIPGSGAAGNVGMERKHDHREPAKDVAHPWPVSVREQSSAMILAVSGLTEGLKPPKIRRTRRAKQRYLQARVEVLAVPTPEGPF